MLLLLLSGRLRYSYFIGPRLRRADKDHTKYVEALAAAMTREYEAIHAAGLSLQVDCPDLAMGRHARLHGLKPPRVRLLRGAA